jgi:hypothetical protein
VFTCLLLDVDYIRNEQTDRADHSENNASQHGTAGMLGHSNSILLTTYVHFIPTMQDEAARVMEEILTPIPIDLRLKA